MTLKPFTLSLCAIAFLTSSTASFAATNTTLNIAEPGTPASLDPQLISGVWEFDIVGDLFEGLMSYDADGNIIPGIAKSWDVSKDGKTYTFHLRDAKWSDGTPVTAQDFVFALRREEDPATAAIFANKLYPVLNARAVNEGKMKPDALGVKALDAHTLQVQLAHPTAYFISLMADPVSYPLPESVVRKYGKEWSAPGHMVSDGAFKLASSVPSTNVTAVKNDQYYDADQVSLHKVVYNFGEEGASEVTGFRAGEEDIVRGFPSDSYSTMMRLDPEAVHNSPWLGIEYYVFNMRKGQPTADRRVREALSMVIRRDVITQKLLKTGEQPAYSFVPEGIDNYTPASVDFKNMPMVQRMQAAKKLLAEAGYGPSHPLNIQLTFNTGETARRMAVAVAAMWAPLGVHVTMSTAEVSVMYRNLEQGNFQIGGAGWVATFNDAGSFLEQFQSNAPYNYGAFHNAEYDALYEKSMASADVKQRAEMMRKAEGILLKEDVIAPILYVKALNLVSPDIQGWKENIVDIHRSRYVSFKN